MRFGRKRRYQAIEPDEILIDAKNLPGFDAGRLEGRLERPIEKSAYRNFLLFTGILFVVFTVQLLRLQVFAAEEYKERAEANRLFETLIFAERGAILDRHGVPLALNTPDAERGFLARAYPLGKAAAQFVGYVSYPKKDQNGHWFQSSAEGIGGVEARFNAQLAGENGKEIRETTATGEVLSGSVLREPEKGTEIVLTLDAGLQEALYSAIALRAEEAHFRGGSGIIMDIHTGELYALASYPSFDPEVLSEGTPQKEIENYVVDPRGPFLDRAVSGLYTPGSVVKPFIALAALEEGVITPQKTILSTGSITIPNPYDPSLPSVFRDWKAHGWVTMRQALAVSSDVYFYAVGGGFEDQPGLGIAAIERYMRLFGFGSESGVELEAEAQGIVPNPSWKAEVFDGERWFLGNTYHTAIGQYGFQVSVLQLARAFAALANDGVLVTPSVLKGEPHLEERLMLDQSHIDVVKEGMRLAVTEGTAAALNLPGVTVAAKTGTAEVGAQKEFINSVIVGFFPYENPRYSFAIVMERAKAGTTAGAPLVAQNVLKWMQDNRPDMLVD